MFEFTIESFELFVKSVGVPVACLCLLIWVFFRVVGVLTKMIESLTLDSKADRDRFRSDYREIESSRKTQHDEWLAAIKKIHGDTIESITKLSASQSRQSEAIEKIIISHDRHDQTQFDRLKES